MRKIVIERASGLVSLQDGGRPGRAHEGVPIGGALDGDALARANLAVGNASGECALERFGPMRLRSGSSEDLHFATEAGSRRRLSPGETLELPWDGARRVRYVAFEGGFDVDAVLGGRGTMLGIGLGGHHGRALRAGDELALATRVGAAVTAPEARDESAPIGLMAGPDLEIFAPDALARLTSRAWTISPRSDRSGTRLEGARIAYREGAPSPVTTPTFPGLIELPPGGEPIVLGPDGPTTGGYPVIAAIVDRDLSRFHAIALARPLRFTCA